MTAIAAPANLKDRVAEHLAKNPRAMTIMMAREFGVPEAEILRAWPDGLCRELNIAGERAVALVKAMERLGRVHVISSNDAVTLESYGYFGGFSVMGPFLNVQTDTLDMHIQFRQLASAFALVKPSHQDGQTTYSIQFYTPAGKSAFKVFLYKSVTEQEGSEVGRAIAEWEAISAEFA